MIGNITNTWEEHTGVRAGAADAQERQQGASVKIQPRVTGGDKKLLGILMNKDNCSPLNYTELQFFLNYTTPKGHVIKLSSLF